MRAGVSADAYLPGFGLRVLPSGRKTWVVLAPNRRKIGRYPTYSLADARKKAKEPLRPLQEGEDPFLQPDHEAGTFGG